jgi:hypothetical protein
MTKAEIEVITSERRRRHWSRAEGARCSGGAGAGSDDPGCGACVRCACEPGVSLASAIVRQTGSCVRLCRRGGYCGSTLSDSAGTDRDRVRYRGQDPQAWLADVLARLPDHPASRITDLLPWNWKAAEISAAA